MAIFGIIASIIGFISLLPITVIHTFLMALNLTTREIGKASKKIWYFKNNTSALNFPFTRGSLHNIRLFINDDEILCGKCHTPTEYPYPEYFY